jgi:hypothetical protein
MGMPTIELSATPGLVVVVVAGGTVALSIAVPLSELLQAPTATSVTRAVIAVIALVRISLLVVRREGSGRGRPEGQEAGGIQ